MLKTFISPPLFFLSCNPATLSSSSQGQPQPSLGNPPLHLAKWGCRVERSEDPKPPSLISASGPRPLPKVPCGHFSPPQSFQYGWVPQTGQTGRSIWEPVISFDFLREKARICPAWGLLGCFNPKQRQKSIAKSPREGD